MANIGYIQVNRYCNNKCHFCSNPSNGRDIDFERGIELINEFKKNNYQGVIFTGGEPTLSKNLINWITYAIKLGLEPRLITNGSITSDFEYSKNLSQSGLKLVHISIYSHIEKIHDFLTSNPGSYKKVIKSIQNMLKLGINVQINTVINKYNQDHLDKIILFLNKNFPTLRHFVWNNLDPQMITPSKVSLSTLPDYNIFSESLINAMNFLYSKNRTFRVERVPLCFMRGFEYVSTETRKIVKNEERLVHFLDKRESVNTIGNDFFHDKTKLCKDCDLNGICAGVYDLNNYYNYVKVIPQKVSKSELDLIINKIKN